MVRKPGAAPSQRDRIRKLEDDLEHKDFVIATYERVVKEVTGGCHSHPGSIRMFVNNLRGEIEALELRRDEQAALASAALECLRRVSTSEMPSDLEAVAHAVCASPRTAATEEAGYKFLAMRADVTLREEIWKLGQKFADYYHFSEKTLLEAERRAVAAGLESAGAQRQSAALREAVERATKIWAETEENLQREIATLRAEVPIRRIVSLGIGFFIGASLSAVLTSTLIRLLGS